jgi:hypothetical protein
MFLPLELTLRPSRIYPLVLLLGFALATGGAMLANLPGWAKLLVALMLLAALARTWRAHQPTVQGVRVSQSGQLAILLDDWQAASPSGQNVVLPWLVSLKLVLENGQKIRLWIWTDSTDANSFRRLRVWLRWGRTMSNTNP